MLARMARTGAYPGSFDPPTVAHLAVVDAVVARAGLQRLDLVVSRDALGKGTPSTPTLADRITVLEQVAAGRTGLGVRVTDARLIVDVVDGYDVVVMGADKWAQVVDPAWYGSDPRAGRRARPAAGGVRRPPGRRPAVRRDAARGRR